MPNVNTNTKISDLTTDIYDVAQFIDDIRANNITDLDETSSMVGIFGYLTEMASQSLQNVLVAVSETTNEALPTKAKFHKNILAHAMNLAITDINAVPASLNVIIYLPIEYIERNFVEYDVISSRGKFILDKHIPFNVNKYEFHLDYDIIINRSKNSKGEFIYTAMYDLFETGTNVVKQLNPLSNITNPYITNLVKLSNDGVDYIAIGVNLHQVKIDVIERTMLTDNDIENKTLTFEYEGQLANFDIDVYESNGTTRHLTPIYNGLLDYTVEDGQWCYYEFIDEYTIRIIFSRDSYVPKLNATININVITSNGNSGNFTYSDPMMRVALKSEKYSNYNGMYALIYFSNNGVSNGGRDKKSMAELKRIIPREAQSRGSVINSTDLTNFFNSINTDNVYIYFFKKRDNPFERLYYAYLIVKKKNTVYPTNTLPVKLEQDNFVGFAGNNNLVLLPGTKFYYYDHGTDTENAYATITKPEYVTGLDEDLYPYPMVYNSDGKLVRVFEYICPFLIAVDDDLISSYLLTIMNDRKNIVFESINTSSDIQFVPSNLAWRRNFIYTDENGNQAEYSNKYIMDVDVALNSLNIDKILCNVSTDDIGNIIIEDPRIKMIMVMYADETSASPYRYLEGKLINYSDNNKLYTFRFEMETNDLMDLNNRINITGIYNAKPEAYQKVTTLEESHGYMNKNTFAKLFVLADFGTKPGDVDADGNEITEDTAEVILYGEDGIGNRTEIEQVVPVKNDIIDEFLKNNIEYIDPVTNEHINVINIIRNNPEYVAFVNAYNGNDLVTEAAILGYLRNNRNSTFVTKYLLTDEDSLKVINSYSYLDLDRYTLCNVLSVDGGLDFYRDYSKLMTSAVAVKQIQVMDDNGSPIYTEVLKKDAYGNEYFVYKPVYKMNDNGGYFYDYTIDRIPMLKADFLNTESTMQDFVSNLEERRKYIEECLEVLEDTFGIDFKFVNTWGPSKRFYYTLPDETSYNVKVKTKKLEVYKDLDINEVVGTLGINTEVSVVKINGIWGYIEKPYEGWIRLADTSKTTLYMDNVSISMKLALEADSSADKNITDGIVEDVKSYIENIDEISEIHTPNIITLITNNYREQVKYFDVIGINNYGPNCKHLYYDNMIDADTCPEFINIRTKDDKTLTPDIDITIH